MNDMVKTVMIETENGPVIINETDYDADKHKLVDEADAKIPVTVPPVVENGEPENLLVTKKGKKFIVVNQNGDRIERAGIEEDGYETEAAAWAAIMALSA